MDEDETNTTAGVLLGVAKERKAGVGVEQKEILHPEDGSVVEPTKTSEAPAPAAAAQVGASGSASEKEERKDSVRQASD